VTLALGIKCSDGIVLGTDLEYTEGDLSDPGQKMFWLPRNAHPDGYFVLAAGYGNPDTAKTFIEELGYKLEPFSPHPTVPTWSSLKKAIREALKIVWTEHIDIAPKDERRSLAFDMLLGLRIGSDVKMYRTNRTMLIEQEGSYCMGVGAYAARALADVFLGFWPHIRVESAAQIAIKIIALTKSHIQGVGQGTDINILPLEGYSYGFLLPEVKEIESEFENLFVSLRLCLAQLEKENPASLYPYCIELFTNSMEGLRTAQKKRSDFRERRSAKRVKKLDPLSTKGDLSLPQPLPDSPGGSDES
jgi:hypothetical protein